MTDWSKDAQRYSGYDEHDPEDPLFVSKLSPAFIEQIKARRAARKISERLRAKIRAQTAVRSNTTHDANKTSCPVRSIDSSKNV